MHCKGLANNTSAAKTFNVTVADQTPPTVSVPSPITKEATSVSGAAVTFVVTATDRGRPFADDHLYPLVGKHVRGRHNTVSRAPQGRLEQHLGAGDI